MAKRYAEQADRRTTGPHFEFWLDDSQPPERSRRRFGLGVRHSVAPAAVSVPPPRRRAAGRRRILIATAALVVAAVAVPVALALGSTASGPLRSTKVTRDKVLAALNATIDSGSFAIRYNQSPPTSSSGGASGEGMALSGQGVIDTNPFAMTATSSLQGLGTVISEADGTTVWESVGTATAGVSGPGTPLVQFASLVMGTLGARQGDVDMMELASPSGYLELDQNAITSASEVGTGEVAGTPVTVYEVHLTPDQQTDPPGATAEEDTAIRNALATLVAQGYTGTSVRISIDAAGYIRETVSVDDFSDGMNVTTDVTFSDFGCAGQVALPGQPVPTLPQGCTSPASQAPGSATAPNGPGTAPAGATGTGQTGAIPGTGGGTGPGGSATTAP